MHTHRITWPLFHCSQSLQTVLLSFSALISCCSNGFCLKKAPHCNTAILTTFQRRQWHPTVVLLPGKSHGWRSLVGYSPWGASKSRTWLSDFTFTFPFHALEKEMATHFSVLAWRIPGTAKPGVLPSVGSHRVGHDWRDLAAAATTF